MKELLERVLADKAASRLKAQALAWPEKIKVIERLRAATAEARRTMRVVGRATTICSQPPIGAIYPPIGAKAREDIMSATSASPKAQAANPNKRERPDIWTTIGRVFKRRITSEADVLTLVQSGVPGKVYSRIEIRLSIPKGTVGPETTLRNRLKVRAGRLTADETQRVIGIARVFALATELFGNEKDALEWMHRPAKLIPDRGPVKPIELAVRDAGVRLLEDRIRRTQYGMF